MLATLKNKLLASDFFRHILMLVSGTVLAQLIPLLLTPVLSRFFTPEQFGIYGVFYALSNILIIVANGKYEQVIMVIKEKEKANIFHTVSLLFSIAFSVLLLSIIIIIQVSDVEINFIKKLGNIIYLLPVSVFLGAAILNATMGLNRGSKYKTISFSKVLLVAVANTFPLVLFMFFGGSGFLLILTWILGQLISVIYLLYYYKKNDVAHFKSYNTNKAHIIGAVKKYKQFPLINAPFSLIDMLATSLPVFFISSLFSDKDVGYFTMASRIITIPSVFISTAIAQVLFKKIADYEHNNGDVRSLILKSFFGLFVIAAIAFSIIIFTAPQLFSVFLGNEWTIAGNFAQILAVSAIFKFAISPLSNIFIIKKEIRLLSIWQSLYLITNIVCIIIGWKSNNITYYLYTFIIGETIIYIVYLYFILLLIKKK